MIPVDVFIVSINQKLWTTYPKERPLADFAQDALGIERRISKGVNIEQERRRYVLVTSHIERTVLSLLDDGVIAEDDYIIWNTSSPDITSTDYFRFIDYISSLNEVKGFRYQKTFYPYSHCHPGSRYFGFDIISTLEIAEKNLNSPPDDKENKFQLVSSHLREFMGKAFNSHCSIVQVVTLGALS